MMYKEAIAWESSDGKLYFSKKEAIAASFRGHIVRIRAYLASIETAKDQAGRLETIQDEAQEALEDLGAMEALHEE